MLSTEEKDRIRDAEECKRLNRAWGQIDALYDLYLWLTRLRPLDLDKFEMLSIIEDEVLERAQKVVNEVK